MRNMKTLKKKSVGIFLLLLVVSSFVFNEKDIKKDKIENISSNEALSTDFAHSANSIEVQNNNGSIEYNGTTYKIIEVDGDDLSGERQPNVAVDVGYGDRTYWAFTNEYGQLTNVIADQIILQDESTEPVNSHGRYYDDEAKVPGTERKDLDEGHVIADSLGGVANAYNITPQNSTLNRHGNQAYMEKVIRDANGCDNFVATITYPDITTQIPSKYKYEYVLNGNKIIDEFENANPDEAKRVISQEKNENVASTDVYYEGKTIHKNIGLLIEFFWVQINSPYFNTWISFISINRLSPHIRISDSGSL